MSYQMTKRTWLRLGSVCLALAILGGLGWWFTHRGPKIPQEEKITLKQAAGMGEVATHQLMVQIENPKGREEDLKGRYRRGDIVSVWPGDKQFSEAEETGFLIIKMDLTEKQGEILTQSLNEYKEQPKDAPEEMKDEPLIETLQRRKYAIDLSKIGIADDDQKGRKIDDKTFKWNEVVKEKEKD